MSVWDVLSYTPLVQFLILYGYSYRYDLGRILHGRVQRSDRLAWWKAFSEIGLLGALDEARRPSGIFVPLKFAVLLVVTGAASLLLVPVESLLAEAFPLLLRFQPALFVLLQFIPAVIFLAGLAGLWLGSLPFGPHRHVLPPRRTGSMIRHLREKGERMG